MTQGAESSGIGEVKRALEVSDGVPAQRALFQGLRLVPELLSIVLTEMELTAVRQLL